MNCHFYAPGEKGFKYHLDRIISQKFLKEVKNKNGEITLIFIKKERKFKR